MLSGFDKERFAALLVEAKGKRSMNEFARDADVSNAHVSRLIRGLLAIPPEPKTIRKLASVAHNEVTYQTLMEAAGHLTNDEIRGKVIRLEELKRLQRDQHAAEDELETAGKQLRDANKEVEEAEAELISLNHLSKIGAEHVTSLLKVPVLGFIAAGQPIFATEHILEWDYVINPGYNEGELFSLVVKGDSMIGSRIFEGDKVLVKVQPEVEEGEIAVVNVDGELATLKRVRKIEGKFLLMADNPRYEPIIVDSENARVCGKVIQVIFDPNQKY